MNRYELLYKITQQYPSITLCDKLTTRKLMYFKGNQWNCDWDWSRNALEALSDNELQALYDELVADKKKT